MYQDLEARMKVKDGDYSYVPIFCGVRNCRGFFGFLKVHKSEDGEVSGRLDSAQTLRFYPDINAYRLSSRGLMKYRAGKPDRNRRSWHPWRDGKPVHFYAPIKFLGEVREFPARLQCPRCERISVLTLPDAESIKLRPIEPYHGKDPFTED